MDEHGERGQRLEEESSVVTRVVARFHRGQGVVDVVEGVGVVWIGSVKGKVYELRQGGGAA